VARVDPGDDSITRFIVHHYRYDPQRRERRHVAVAAFDNEPEYRACMRNVQDEIKGRRERGEPVDAREHASGVVHEPGYLRRAANGHVLSRAIRHGATGSWIEELELPSNISVLRAERRAGRPSRLVRAAWLEAIMSLVRRRRTAYWRAIQRRRRAGLPP
jgi:hypothetical protein